MEEKDSRKIAEEILKKQLTELELMELGSEEHKKAVEDITKLWDAKIQESKICEAAYEEQTRMELEKLKHNEEIRKNSNDEKIRKDALKIEKSKNDNVMKEVIVRGSVVVALTLIGYSASELGLIKPKYLEELKKLI